MPRDLQDEILIRQNVINTYNKFFVDMKQELQPVIYQWRKKVGQDIYIEYENPLVKAIEDELHEKYALVKEENRELRDELSIAKNRLKRNGIV